MGLTLTDRSVQCRARQTCLYIDEGGPHAPCHHLPARRRRRGTRRDPVVDERLFPARLHHVSFLAGSSAPTPLYPLYQARWGFSAITVTVVFGIYALALLGSLLVAGRLSDHLGRRPILMAATAVQAAAMLVFADAGGVPALLVARILQGLSTGAALAAIGAGMLDLDRTRGAIANAVAPPAGTALGALVAALMVHCLPAPTHLVYLSLAAIFVVQGVGVFLMSETNAPRPGAMASLKPQFCLPAAARRPLLVATPILVAIWALVGFYASLGPGLVHRVFGLDSSLLGGVALFVLTASSGGAVFAVRAAAPWKTMRFGAATLLAGVAAVVAALSVESTPLFFFGTSVAGVGFGAAFHGALRSVVGVATPRESAGVLSVIFVIAYLAMSVPAVVAGGLVAEDGNLVATAQGFGAFVMVLAGLALWGASSRRAL